jgi:hypothetical protein
MANERRFGILINRCLHIQSKFMQFGIKDIKS